MYMNRITVSSLSPPLTTMTSATVGAQLPARTVAFTTPSHYADRLAAVLTLHGHAPLWIPTLTVSLTPDNLRPHLLPSTFPSFTAIAFPSRAAIASFSSAVSAAASFPLLPTSHSHPLTLSALGNDSDLLTPSLLSLISPNANLIDLLIPTVPSPDGLIDSLGNGCGSKLLLPAPKVVGISEPPVVPDFVMGLTRNSWEVVRADAYETRWLGHGCAEAMVRREGWLDAVVFTSSGEVEGLLKGLQELGWDWEMVRRRWPGMVVAAHGPVTAKGAERLGVRVDVVGERFGSFDGVVEGLNRRWKESP
ncbi:hypothetical protein MLD38_014953 [Melastoma candidum]|uniref:Uncharacterized protein n=1 Tax=Melastoma candidum TaxID=119954 RepID=A0ACB9RIP2_9MYRT|nr:hypothetical protein MLD38_014953 [Melastoma candidum]